MPHPLPLRVAQIGVFEKSDTWSRYECSSRKGEVVAHHVKEETILPPLGLKPILPHLGKVMSMLEALQSAVSSHSGSFLCVEIHREANTKVVPFRHIGSPPDTTLPLPDVPGLKPFYDTYEHLTMYVDEQSGEAAYYLASPSQWANLDGDFRPWLDDLDEDEAAEYLPTWINDCIVVGEIPRSGNYLLVPSSGADAGKVFEFEHDGLEFIELGESLPQFVAHTLDLDTHRLTAIASHLRFITTDDKGSQWWIKELRDNRGNVVRTEA